MDEGDSEGSKEEGVRDAELTGCATDDADASPKSKLAAARAAAATKPVGSFYFSLALMRLVSEW